MRLLSTKNLIIAECERISEILRSDVIKDDKSPWFMPEAAELKCKMAELRRDTMRLEKMIYCPKEFKEGYRI